MVLAIIFTVMNAASMKLDRISLGALIIALGLLVDDAIIAVEMMVVKMEEGLNRTDAAAFAWTSTAFPMLTGTLVTAAGFLPVGFAKSSAGEYAGGIFWVVGLSLVISWFVAVIFTPYLGVKLLPTPKHAGTDGGAGLHTSRPYRLLRSAVNWSVAHRKTVIGAVVLAFAFAIVGFTFVPKQFFPTSSRPELFIELRLPEGSAIAATEVAAQQAERLLVGDPDVKTYTTYIGAGSPRFFLALNPVLPDESFALVVIMTTGPEGRERLKAKLERAAAEGAVPGARMRIDRLNFGPPVGFPVQFRVIGPDPKQLREIAASVREIMRQNPDARDAQFDWNEQAKVIRLEVDQERARVLGLTPQEISFTLQALLTGYKIAEYREGINLIPVVARAAPSERLNLDGFADLTVPTRGGTRVPLSQIAHIRYDFEDPILWRRNRDFALTVRADVREGVQPPTVSTAILAKLQGLIRDLPPGFRIETGGSIEESNKANNALFKIFPAMFLVMLTLLMVQLQNFSKLFLVFSTAPLGLIGASGFLLAFDAPFGFTALLGLIALGGMIMRNTVILVEQIDEDMRSGLSQWDAIVESTIRRSRPVVLTALAAILAMIPLSRSIFWAPMAITLMGGLLVGTVLTLLFLPALYAFWFGVRRDQAFVKRQHKPLRPAVEHGQPSGLLVPGE
jgi:multidrug efflux pump subunit AcrB